MESTSYRTFGRYLTFRVGLEEYGIGVHRVLEIIGPVVMEEASHLPPHTRGTVRLQNRAIPVFDLRSRFGLEAVESEIGKCVLIVRVKGWDGPFWMGLLVDGIGTVLQVNELNLEKTPAMEGDSREGLLLGLARCPEGVVL